MTSPPNTGGDKEQNTKKELISHLNTIVTIVSCALIALCAVFSKPVSAAVLKGLKVAAAKAVPALFPASVLSGFLTAGGFAEKLTARLGKPFSRIFGLHPKCFLAYLLGLLAGYPTGATVIADLKENGLIDEASASKACCLCVNCGISFIFGVCAGDLSEGVLLLSVHIFSGFLSAAAALKVCKASEKTLNSGVVQLNFTRKNDVKINSFNGIIKCFTGAVFSAAAGMFRISALIALFYPISEILTKTLENPLIKGLAVGFFELTSGAVSCEGPYRLILLAFITGFGGLCVLAQSAVFLSDSGIGLKYLLVGKLFHGIISAILCAAIFFLFKM